MSKACLMMLARLQYGHGSISILACASCYMMTYRLVVCYVYFAIFAPVLALRDPIFRHVGVQLSVAREARDVSEKADQPILSCLLN